MREILINVAMAVVVVSGVGLLLTVAKRSKDETMAVGVNPKPQLPPPPAPPRPPDAFGASHSEHTRTQDGQPVSGFSSGPGFQIVWQSQQAPTGATPLDVLESVQSRLQHMQKTKLGGDEIARALWEVNKAVEALSPTMRREGGSSGAGFVLPEGK